MSTSPAIETTGALQLRCDLRVAICPFDTAYDYELAKLPYTMLLVENTHRRWDWRTRPLPQSLSRTYSLNDADVLLLGISSRTLEEIETRLLFRSLRERFAGPTVVIDHGFSIEGKSSAMMRELVQDSIVVCTSTRARGHWSAGKIEFIPRAYDPAEWPISNYSRGNIVVYSNSDQDHINNCAADLISDRLAINVSRIGSHSFDSFDRYRAFLARSSIFFNASHAAPNLSAMVEAQLCGLAVVTTNMNGESSYINNGVNGFVSNDVNELIGVVAHLRQNPLEIESIGRNGRIAAERRFGPENFIKQWNAVLSNARGVGLKTQIYAQR